MFKAWPIAIALACCASYSTGCSDRDDILESGEKLYSQNDEELIIRHFFGDRRDGFFLDVGSFHWRNNSTTLYLEKHLGWSGIAIDANQKLAGGYETNRPRTKFFSYLVTDHSDTIDKFYLAGAVSSTDREYLDQFDNIQDRIREIEVPSITLNDLLDREGVEKIDFLSMDIEQSEPQALAGFDIERYRPELVCIEASGPVRDAITAYFTEHGYERIDEYLRHDYVNWYYRPRRAD